MLSGTRELGIMMTEPTRHWLWDMLPVSLQNYIVKGFRKEYMNALIEDWTWERAELIEILDKFLEERIKFEFDELNTDIKALKEENEFLKRRYYET